MIIEINKDNYSKYTDDNFLVKNKIETELESNPFSKYIIFYEDEVKGYLYYSKIYDRVEINQIEVKEKYRNNKIGSIILKYLIDKEKTNISLEVNINNIPAIALYKKYNFKQTTIRKNYYQGTDGILMERIYKK